ncbi:hypothetical protein AKJ09_08675 [Labilithrix luteola]|uniref:Uncharacterized protein n=1 Tax=Labilithrix luteola TaxID=1391654 RepID=A0A0K1Q8L3_9BACT|nr:hypothetical protein AKJ09_08675 [Labilithrix luteola]
MQALDSDDAREPDRTMQPCHVNRSHPSGRDFVVQHITPERARMRCVRRLWRLTDAHPMSCRVENDKPRHLFIKRIRNGLHMSRFERDFQLSNKSISRSR